MSNPAISQSIPSHGTPLQTSEIATTGTLRNAMVVKGSTGLTSYTYKLDLSSAHDGCIGFRLGSSAGRHENVRTVDKTATVVACQSQRAVCCLRGNTTREQPPSQCSHFTANRQPNSRSLHKQGRRNEIEEASEPHTTTIGGDGPLKSTTDGLSTFRADSIAKWMPYHAARSAPSGTYSLQQRTTYSRCGAHRK